MFSIALKLRLKPGKYHEYKRAHDNLWPELAEGMKRSNVSMAIYRDGQSLIVFATAPTESDWMRSRQDPVLEKWNHYMADFLQVDNSGELLFECLEKTFGFGMHAPDQAV